MTLTRWLGAGLAAICAVLGLWLCAVTQQRDAARREAASWQESSRKNQAALADLTTAHARLQMALKERERTLAELAGERAAQREKLWEMMRNDAAVSGWGGSVLPSAVGGMFH